MIKVFTELWAKEKNKIFKNWLQHLVIQFANELSHESRCNSTSVRTLFFISFHTYVSIFCLFICFLIERYVSTHICVLGASLCRRLRSMIWKLGHTLHTHGRCRVHVCWYMWCRFKWEKEKKKIISISYTQHMAQSFAEHMSSRVIEYREQWYIKINAFNRTHAVMNEYYESK